MESFTLTVLLAVFLLVASSAAPQNTKLSITIPEECKGKGFCSIRPEGYDEIEAQINALFPKHLIAVGSRSVGFRITNLPDDDDNCPSVTTWESVYAYNDPTGTGLDIFVQTELFTQELAKVTCKHSNREHFKYLKEGSSQCFRKLGLSEFNTVSRCEQSYATRTLMVYDPAEHLIKMKNYTVPVCCSCVTRKK